MAPRLASAAALAVCGFAHLGGCAVDELDAARGALVGGVAAPDDHAVVLIDYLVEGALRRSCTGTLVAPDLVLTAAHCMPAADETLAILFGRAFDDPAPLGVRGVIASASAPGWNGDHQRGHDLAMLRLDAPAPAAAVPVPVLARPLELAAGTPVRLVGFGLTLEAAEPFERRTAETTVSFATAEIVFVGDVNAPVPEICDGDSGGPILAEVDGVETVVAVASFSDPLCRSSSGGSRLDADLDVVAAWLGGGDDDDDDDKADDLDGGDDAAGCAAAPARGVAGGLAPLLALLALARRRPTARRSGTARPAS